MHITKILLGLLFLSLISCSESHRLLNFKEAQCAFIMNSSATFKGYYYQGTDSKFHYFSSQWLLAKDRYFKLVKEDFYVNEPFEYGRHELRIDVWKTKNIFGKSESQEIYICPSHGCR